MKKERVGWNKYDVLYVFLISFFLSDWIYYTKKLVEMIIHIFEIKGSYYLFM